MAKINQLIKILEQSNKGETKTSRFPLPQFLNKDKKIKYDIDLIKLAYEFAKEAHKGQTRKSGVPYIEHPLATAIILAEMRMDEATIIAGLLHDVPEDTHYSLVDVEKEFGEEVAMLVGGITKLGVIKYRGMEKYAENLRRMFFSMAQDIRIVIIKMADRLHNLQTLDSLPPEKQLRIARESLEIYASIAHRLGMGYIKGEIEDLAFKYVYPEKYEMMVKDVMPKMKTKLEYIQKIMKIIEKEVKKNNIKIVDIHGRKKRLYSLYKKLQKPHYAGDSSKIFDLVAIRIIVPTVGDCYNALGIIHQLWTPLPGRIKDHIAQPKPNGYQSLHSTVFCDDGKIVEFQIRTTKMHIEAEYGIAAHWKYKEGISNNKGYNLPRKFEWIKDLVTWQQGVADNKQYLKSLAIDFFENRIFVFTPEGDVIDLPENSTAVDFAYHVHTWIGDHCSGVKVNNRISTLDAPLKNGDMVEIITDKNRKAPSIDWVKTAKTGAAKSKIKSAVTKNRKNKFNN